MIQTLQHNVSGWVEWNLALDTFGHPNRDIKKGDCPNCLSCHCQRVLQESNFYVLGQFSKYIVPDSVRVDITSSKTKNSLNFVALERPDNSTVVVVYNLGSNPIDLVSWYNWWTSCVTYRPKTVQTYIYWIKNYLNLCLVNLKSCFT